MQISLVSGALIESCVFQLHSLGMYDPSEYDNLNVAPDIKELFQHIMRYTPQTIDLETRFKPFIPEYIPAVGDIDAFIKGNQSNGELLAPLLINNFVACT